MWNVELDENHKYTVAGYGRRPGVSEVLSSVGVKRNGYWNSISGAEHIVGGEDASIFGKAVHAYIEYDKKRIKCDYDPAMEAWVLGYLQFDIDFPNTPISYDMIEKPLYSAKYGYCGTPDYPAFVRGRPKDEEIKILIDWKTATAMQDHWRMQKAAYCQLIQENFPSTGPLCAWTVRIFENGYELDQRNLMEVRADFNKFLSVLNVYKMAA